MKSYDGVALVCPVSVPYVRQTHHGAAWFIGMALRSLLGQSGLKKTDIDGFVASSFSLGSDSAIAL